MLDNEKAKTKEKNREIIDLYYFFEPKDKALFNKITRELRCSVCQNQSLADSGASLAVDLREVIYQQVSAHRSEREILEFVSSRYGEFVLYSPPLKASTTFLWSAPFILLLVGFYVISRFFYSSPK